MRSAGCCAQMRRFSDEQDTLNRNLALSGDAGGQRVAGSARSRLKAQRSSCTHGHERCRWRVTRRPLRAKRPATWSSRYRRRLGSQRCASPVRQSLCVHASRSCAVRTNASHTAFSAKPWNGRFLIPVSLPQRMRSSTRAWPRWRASRYAMSVSSWSVMKT